MDYGSVVTSDRLDDALRTYAAFLLADDSDREAAIRRSGQLQLSALADAIHPLYDEITSVLDRLAALPHPLPHEQERLEDELNSLAQAGLEARAEFDRRNFRRSWTLAIGGREHVVTVKYAILSGFMSIEIDGRRVARAWREFQTVIGGANLDAQLDGHTLSARITQRFGTQAYLFSLRLDGKVMHGSDPQPAPRKVTRQTWSGIFALATTIAVITQIGRFPLIAGLSVVVGLASMGAINTNRISGRWRLLVIVALLVVWVIGMYEIAQAFYRRG